MTILFGEFACACNAKGEFNKCKGGDPVSEKVLERGVGLTLEVTC